MIPLFKSAAGVRYYWRDVGGGNYEIVQTFDSEPILEANKAMATHNDGYSPSRELRRVASIPMALIYKWMNEEGWDALDPACGDKLREKLNSSDYAFLRTAPGRV